MSDGNLDRFSGFAGLYDASRPQPPFRLGRTLCAYARSASPRVVDLGSGTGLSTRWASTWATDVVGIEPNDDMREMAIARGGAKVSYRAGTSHATGLPGGCADVVTAVQAMHWMEPAGTHAEVARLLRPGGVFAVIDADWPPVTGVPGAEAAWVEVHRRIRVLEARVANGVPRPALVAGADRDDPALVDEDQIDPHRRRAMPGGVVSWSKSEHLARMAASGAFGYCRELVMDEPVDGTAERFVALLRSQGSYQDLAKRGLSDDEIGATRFEADARAAFAATTEAAVPMSFCWRIRLGVR
jgi:SAM-dependent methyltransferase